MLPTIQRIAADTLTFGQQAVGLSFNPSGDDKVSMIKKQFADVIDSINDVRENSYVEAEVYGMCSIAITEAQTAQMWAVKAVTWKKG